MSKGFFKLLLLFKGLFYRRSRLFVAVAAVTCGAAMLLSLLAIFMDIPEQYGREFSNYGANFLIRPLQGESRGTGAGAASQVDDGSAQDSNGSAQDSNASASQAGISATLAEAVKNFLNTKCGQGELLAFTPYAYRKIKINEQPFVLVLSDMEAVEQSSSYWLVDGEWAHSDSEIMLGQEVAAAIRKAVGEEVIINLTSGDQKSMNDRDVKAATYNVSGTIQSGGNEEEVLYAPLAAYARLSKEIVSFDVLECSLIADTAKLQRLAQELQEEFPQLQAVSARRLTASKDQVLGKLQVLILLVSVIIIALTFVSVTTTMTALINERRTELALHKALGAHTREVRGKFLGEALIIALAGGLIGSACAYFLAERISVAAFARHLNFPLFLLPWALAVTVAVTLAAVHLPLKGLNDIEPAVVLKGE